MISTLSLLPVLALPVLLPDRVIYRIPSPWVFFSTAVQIFALLFLCGSPFRPKDIDLPR